MSDIRQPSFEDMQLQVGARLQLTLASQGENNWYSTLIGYVLGEYLLLKIPTDGGLPVPLQEGEHVVVRAFSGVSVYTFASTIESILLAPRDYMHLSFPQQIVVTPVRQAPRVKVNLPVEVSNAPSTHENLTRAALSDLSLTGAFIAAHEELGGPGHRITIRFAFRVQPTNQEVRIRTEATIRHCRRLGPNGKTDGQTLIMHGTGIHFDSMSEIERFMLQHYLYETENSIAH